MYNNNRRTMITLDNYTINLFDGDTENELGEMHCVESIAIDADGEVILNMDDGDTWEFSDLSDYEKSLVIETARAEVNEILSLIED